MGGIPPPSALCVMCITPLLMELWATLFAGCGKAAFAFPQDNLALMPVEICVRVFRFLIENMVGFVGFVLFRIFNDFRKVFDAVFQLADGLLCFFFRWRKRQRFFAPVLRWNLSHCMPVQQSLNSPPPPTFAVPDCSEISRQRCQSTACLHNLFSG